MEKFNQKMCEMHKNPINCLLHLIAAIVAIYALWQHNIELILVAFLIAVVGHIIQAATAGKEGKKGKKKGKKGAMELSIGTIVIIVIAMTMLILGIVFVRSVMCGALGLTGDLNNKVRGEINALFGSTGGEVQCVGSDVEPVRMIPGKVNAVWCGIKAPQSEKYFINLVESSAVYSTNSEIKTWLVTESWEGPVAPGDEDPKKAIRLNIPDNAPEDTLFLKIIISKGTRSNIISTQDLDFEISRQGFFRAAMC